MADEPDDQLPQDPQSAHEGQPQTDATGRNGAGSTGHDIASEGQRSRAEIERERRARRGFIKQMCEDFGIDSEAAAALAEQVELLRPNAERMSTSEDVAERLAQAIEGPFGSRNKLIKPRGTGSDCDLADADGKRDLTKLPLGDILKSEQELLYALIINERMKGGFEARATQHDSLGRMLMAEFVRRHHLHETWRHMVPKRFLPLIAALIAADVKYDDIKPNSALLNALLEAIVTWSEGRNAADVKRNKTPPFMVREIKALQEAAKTTEEELWATMREGFAASATPEDFAAMQNRLAEKIRRHEQELAQLGEGSGPQIDDAAVAELQNRLGNLVRIEELGGAIDQGERVVFPSLDPVAAVLAGLPSDMCSVQGASVTNEPNREGGKAGSAAVSTSLITPWSRNVVPSTDAEWREALSQVPRSTGLSRSIYDRPFAGWEDRRMLVGKDAWTYVPLRHQPDMSSKEGQEGPIEPADLARIEVGPGPWRMIKFTGDCDIGSPHELMLPPHSSLRWYGEQLGRPEADCDRLSLFGSPAKPHTVNAGGDIHLLMRAFRSHAKDRVLALRHKTDDPFAPVNNEDALLDITESLSRYWLFVLLARHRQDQFCNLLGESFFHGVVGPDFFIDADGSPVFCPDDSVDHFVQIYAPSIEQNRRAGIKPDDPIYRCDDPEYASVEIYYDHGRGAKQKLDFSKYY